MTKRIFCTYGHETVGYIHTEKSITRQAMRGTSADGTRHVFINLKMHGKTDASIQEQQYQATNNNQRILSESAWSLHEWNRSKISTG